MPTSRRRFLRGIAVVGVGALLAGCAEGTRSDAERGKETDAQRDSVVKDLQATETYRLVNSSGGTPTPESEE